MTTRMLDNFTDKYLRMLVKSSDMINGSQNLRECPTHVSEIYKYKNVYSNDPEFASREGDHTYPVSGQIIAQDSKFVTIDWRWIWYPGYREVHSQEQTKLPISELHRVTFLDRI